jgi:hypothetical protein
MWTANSVDIRRFQGGDGSAFAELVIALLEAEATKLAIPLSKLDSTLRTTISDGGIDACLRQGSDADKTGWLAIPTAWQFKATAYPSVSDDDLRAEINKLFAAKLVGEGYGYRLCICDDPPANKVEAWEKILNEEAIKINATASSAKVINASRIADWLNRYAALYIRFVDPSLFQLQPLATLGQIATSVTKNYVPVAEWENCRAQLLKHVDFSLTVFDAVYAVLGAPGVGKTRLAYEAIRSVDGAAAVCVYTANEEIAERVAITLSNLTDKRAIIIADECPPSTRFKLSEILRGCKHRVRVVGIYNESLRSAVAAPPPWVSKIPEETVVDIIAQNFSHIAQDQRRLYAKLSGGFVRIVSWLCEQHDTIITAGHIGPALGRLEEYYRARFTDDPDRRVMEALALAKKVGGAGEVRVELEELCAFVGINIEQFLQVADRLKDTSGFVVRGGRYYYITPEPIAQIAFANGYQRWIAADPRVRVAAFPPSLLQSFLNRVRDHGSEVVRRDVGEVFRAEITSLTPNDLSNSAWMQRAVVIIETEPAKFLPLLRQLVESATREQLMAPAQITPGQRDTRRQLVWSCQQLVRFPEFFADAESILWRLALAESEPGLGNNATGVWRQIFQVAVSGTAVGFSDRLALLEKRATDGIEGQALLSLDGFRAALNHNPSGIGGPELIAGMIPPADWKPTTYEQWADCDRATLIVLERVAKTVSPAVSQRIGTMLVEYVGPLVSYGLLPEAREILKPPLLDDDLLPKLQQALEEILFYDHLPQKDEKPDPDAEQALRDWLKALQPRDFKGRLYSALGKDPWHYSGEERKSEYQAWERELEELAKLALESPSILAQNLEFLRSKHATSVGSFATILGRRDNAAVFFDLLTTDCERSQSTAIVRWYLAALTQSYAEFGGRANTWLDQLDEVAPTLAYEVATTAGERLDALNRVLRLIDLGKLTPRYLRAFMSGAAIRNYAPERFIEILRRLLPPVASGDASATETALDLLGMWLGKDDLVLALRNSDDIRNMVWEIFAVAKPDMRNVYIWRRILDALAHFDFPRAVKIASAHLVSQSGISVRDQIVKLLIDLAQRDSTAVMTGVGEVMVDSERGKRFYVEEYRQLFAKLPTATVQKWIELTGVEGARKVARHLQLPTLDANKQPIIPPLTEFVLRQFENDDRTFQEFCTGAHAGQWYNGDIAGKHETEARKAEQFLNHPMRRVREWAEIERKTALDWAEYHRTRNAEIWLE